MNKKEDEFLEDLEENQEDGDDLDLDETIKLSPKKIAVFGGVFVLAVLICIPLWMLTHAGMDKEKDRGIQESESRVEETLPEETLESAPEETLQATQETQEASAQSGASEEAADPTESKLLPEATTPTGIPPESEELPQSTASQPAEEPQTPSEPVSGDTGMSFTETSDSVTAKDVTNLRSVPSTEDAQNVVGQLKNGETLSRTGYNGSTGWSRLDYNGQTVYAVTNYLTTDLSYKTPVTPSNPNRVNTLDGRVIIFADCDDYVTPKEYVNLRTEPSTSEGDSTIRCQVSKGENVHRTGYSADSGWSRVEYNGEILYVVSSLMTNV